MQNRFGYFYAWFYYAFAVAKVEPPRVPGAS
jgi:hypothetical protein